MVTTRSSANGATKSPAVADDYSPGHTNSKTPRAKKRKSDATLEDSVKRPKIQDKTDKTRWRCHDDNGALTWRYLEDDDAAEKWPQSYAEKWYLGFDLVSAYPPSNFSPGD